MLAGLAGRPLDVRRAEREAGDVHRHRRRHARARPPSSGSRPRTALEDGLAAELEWVRERSARSLRAQS